MSALLRSALNGRGSWRIGLALALVALAYGIKASVIDTAAVMNETLPVPANALQTAIWDTTPPTATSIGTTNGGSKNGRAEPGDSIILTFSEPMSTTSIKPGWDGSTVPVSVTIENNVPDYADKDAVTFNVNLGVIDLGGKNYTKAPYSAFDAQMTWDEPSLTITVVLTGVVTDNIKTGGKKTATYHPDPAMTDTGRVGIDAGVTPTVKDKHF